MISARRNHEINEQHMEMIKNIKPDLFITMFDKRILIRTDGNDRQTRYDIFRLVRDWLLQNASGLYHIEQGFENGVCLWFENDADMVASVMRFSGVEG